MHTHINVLYVFIVCLPPHTHPRTHPHTHTHTHTHSTRAERAYEASTEAESLQEKDKNNSIFVSALKEHLDDGTLNQRLDTLLTDAAAKVAYRARVLIAKCMW